MIRYIGCLLILWPYLTGRVYSQTFELNLFKSVCSQIEQQNRTFLFKKDMPGTILIEDPVTGEQTIIYDTTKTPSLDSFKKLSKKQQIELLFTSELPNFPLKDTTYIVDTTLVFSEGLNYKCGNILFLSTRWLPNQSAVSILNLHRQIVRKDVIYIGFSFPNDRELYMYGSSIKDGQLNPAKSFSFDPYSFE